MNRTLPDHARVKRFVNLHKEFDADDGEITRTRKLRRNVIDEHYAAVIQALYSDTRSVRMKAQITYDTGETGVIERELALEDL